MCAAAMPTTAFRPVGLALALGVAEVPLAEVALALALVGGRRVRAFAGKMARLAAVKASALAFAFALDGVDALETVLGLVPLPAVAPLLEGTVHPAEVHGVDVRNVHVDEPQDRRLQLLVAAGHALVLGRVPARLGV